MGEIQVPFNSLRTVEHDETEVGLPIPYHITNQGALCLTERPSSWFCRLGFEQHYWELYNAIKPTDWGGGVKVCPY